jgi:hypothetical protein
MMVLATFLVLLGMVFAYYVYEGHKYSAQKIRVRLRGGFPFRGDTFLGYALKPNLSIVEESENNIYHIYSDDRGFRVSSSIDKIPGQVSIMTIGCSYGFGYRVDNPFTFTSLLGERFRVNVANLALPGYSTVQALQMLRLNLDLKPRIIVYGIIEDHIRRNLSPCGPTDSPFCRAVSFVAFDVDGKPYIHLPRIEIMDPDMYMGFSEEVLCREGFGIRDVLWRIKADLYKFGNWQEIGYPNDPTSRRSSLRFLLHEMKEAADEINARLIVAYLPLFGKERVNPPPQELIDCLSGTGILFVDVSRSVAEHYRREAAPPLTIPGDYSHPGVLGHAVIADELERMIRGMGLN